MLLSILLALHLKGIEMNKPKMIISALIYVALAVFFIVAIWPALQSGNEGYNTKTSGVIVNKPMEEMTEEPVVESQAEQIEAEISVVEEDISEPAPVVTEVIEPEVVEDVVTPSEPAPTVEATTHEVRAQVVAFSPLVIFIQPGDLVAWGNMNGHDTKSLEGLIPEGAEAWHSKLGESYQRTFTVEGVYIYKCTPHFGAGMGGVIVVGSPTNFEAILASGQKGAAKRLVKKAKVAIAAHTF